MRQSLLVSLLVFGALTAPAHARDADLPRRSENATSPFTYEVLGATPSLRFTRPRSDPSRAARIDRPAFNAVEQHPAKTAALSAEGIRHDTRLASEEARP